MLKIENYVAQAVTNFETAPQIRKQVEETPRGRMSEQLTKVFVYSLATVVALYLLFKPRGKG
jgi:hypothetical protein